MAAKDIAPNPAVNTDAMQAVPKPCAACMAPVTFNVGRRAAPGPQLLEGEMRMDRITGFDSRNRDGAKRAQPTERELFHLELSGVARRPTLV